MEALSKIQKKVMVRFNAGGTLEIVQQPDLTSGIAHIWITSNRVQSTCLYKTNTMVCRKSLALRSTR